MKIGVISDTHGYLDPKVAGYFLDCDEIWHLGDFGSMEVVQSLAAIKPLKGVYGNIDGIDIREKFPLELRFNCVGLEIMMVHIGGSPPGYGPGIKKKLLANPPNIFLCGHSHILKVMADKSLHNLLYINPGAAGNQGLHKMRTILRFDIQNRKPQNMEVIELGKRGDWSSAGV
jgi:uncharacterized protein